MVQLNQKQSEKGQTVIEYIMLTAMMTVVIFAAMKAMQTPLPKILTTISKGFEGVVRYGDRGVRANNSYDAKHPGHPSKVVPRHF